MELAASKRRWFVLMAAALVAAGCETKNPLDVVDEILAEGVTPVFTGVAIDRLTMSPASNTTLSAGSQVSYRADVAWQRDEAEVSASSSVPLTFSMDLYDINGNWGGRATSVSTTASGSMGAHSFSGTAPVPVSSGWCDAYAVAQFKVALRAAAGGTAVSDGFVRVATGSQGLSSTCVYGDGLGLGLADATDFLVGTRGYSGEPVLIRGQELSAPVEARFDGVTGVVTAIYLDLVAQETIGSRTYDYVMAWLPVTIRSGAADIRIGGQIVPYGAETPPYVTVSEPDVDWLEPNNSISQASFVDLELFHPAFEGMSLFFQLNPGLTIVGADRSPNTLGFSSTYGQGDMFAIDVPYNGDLCTAINFAETVDDLDLVIFDTDLSRYWASASADSDEALRLENIPGGTRLWIWVTPWAMNSANGPYNYMAVDCTYLGDSAGAPGLTAPAAAVVEASAQVFGADFHSLGAEVADYAAAGGKEVVR